METYGDGGFTFGYFGGMMDAATGLLYMGNGQYYDPYTGRFLTRDAKPGQSNPYTPYDPIGALVAPLGLLSLYYSRKKNPGKLGMWLVLLIVVGSVGMGLSACFNNPTGEAVTASAKVVIPAGTATPTVILTLPATVTFTPSPPTETATKTPVPPTCTLTPSPTPTLDEYLALYGVTLNGDIKEWTDFRRVAVKNAVRAVATKLAKIVGGTLIDVFRGVYGYINITWGSANATGTCANIDVGGCTSSRHQINFATLSDDSLRARNNVVHELGHAFASFWPYNQEEAKKEIKHPENVHPGILLDWTQTYPGYEQYYIKNFPNRPTSSDGGVGGYYGFASRQNILTWQVAVTLAGDPSEEFADQFLGWTFDKWQPPDDKQQYGVLRRDWMDKYMPGWIRRIIRG